MFFGTLLCVLLAFFAVERRVAAYPMHNVAAATIAATGVQKPEHVSFSEPLSFEAPLLFACVIAMLPVCQSRYVWQLIGSLQQTAFSAWAPTPLAVRPPPAL